MFVLMFVFLPLSYFRFAVHLTVKITLVKFLYQSYKKVMFLDCGVMLYSTLMGENIVLTYFYNRIIHI
jgi:hypothetical protein